MGSGSEKHLRCLPMIPKLIHLISNDEEYFLSGRSLRLGFVLPSRLPFPGLPPEYAVGSLLHLIGL